MAAPKSTGFDPQRWASKQLAWEARERRLAEGAETEEPTDGDAQEHSAAYQQPTERPRSYGRLRAWRRAATASR